MELRLTYKGYTIIDHKPSEKQWWITGFNPNPKYLDAKASDLNVKFTVRFTKSSLYRSFKNAWRRKWSCNDSRYSASYSF